MKNQVRSLKSIFFVLLVILGVDAFTRPNQAMDTNYDLTEGKIQAVEQEKAELALLNAGFLQAQNDYVRMNSEFDILAGQSEASLESLPQLSVISQTLYVYEKEIRAMSFSKLSIPQKKALLQRLTSVKAEFYKALSSASYEFDR